jgi:hypothetical protein
MGSDKGALRDQTALNIQERSGRRKQKESWGRVRTVSLAHPRIRSSLPCVGDTVSVYH